jgi:hypothetical protein
LRYAWVESLGCDSRIMARFMLFTDAVRMLPAFQERETRERAG